MSQKLQSEMSFRPGKMSEESEFCLRELYEEITNLRVDLDMDGGSGGPVQHLLALTMQNDALTDQVNALLAAQTINEATISKLQEAVQALAAKLDAEDVTNMDTDYLATANDKLF